jgi:hypothetical protein
MALFRIAAAAGLLLAVAPDQTRQAIGALFRQAEDVQRAAPSPQDAAAAALAYCRENPEACMKAAAGAREAERRLRP